MLTIIPAIVSNSDNPSEFSSINLRDKNASKPISKRSIKKNMI